ncbi:MAG TPA: penicillin-binding protein 2 [Candidatus Microsaccharimonas sp.]|nr:penicillin-binding protein 2 [Candidatus Microsaccharimonas sp.]
MAYSSSREGSVSSAIKRIHTWYALLILVVGLFGVRLFYLQIIRYDHYKQAALSDQLHQKEIPATRGTIEVHDGEDTVPIVLNQKLYTIFADPVDIQTYKTDVDKASVRLASVLGGNVDDYSKGLKTKDTRYVVLAKKVTPQQRDKLMGYKLAGLYSEEQDYRAYPQGALASQLLGFVNDQGVGDYGLEQALNKQLSGTPGELKAITDLNGVPLAASKGNVQHAPKNGDKVLLTVNLGMQAQLENILASEYQKTKSKGLSAVVMDPATGKIKAMANYPTYDPAKYSQVSDPKLFENASVSEAIEPGSSMKVLTTAAALDMGVIKPDTTFYDPAQWTVDGFKITDIEEDGGARNQTIASLLNLSLNTGATWELMQMGGGQINPKARNAWYDYLTNRFMFGKDTNIEQGYESAGLVTGPQNNGAGIDLTYANMSFGQGILVTPLQMAAAYSSVLNGGTYYQPYLVDRTTNSAGATTTTKPKALKTGVVSPQVSQDLVPLMEYVVDQHHQDGFGYLDFPSQYAVGGKTGTAQIANPAGGYYADKYNGTYAGFVGGDQAQYIIVVFNTQPGVAGYAGTYGGQPVFADIAHMLIDNGYVTPKSH